MVLHLTSAAHHVAAGRIEDAVAGSTGDVHCLQNMNVLARHLTVTDEEAGCCE